MDELWNWLFTAWRETLAPLLAPLWDSVAVWRALGLTFAIGLVLAYRQREHLRAWLMEPRKAVRDRMTFKQANAILSEETLYAQLERLPQDRTDMARLERLRMFLSAEGNQFFNRAIADASGRLVVSLSSLSRFLTASITPDTSELRDLSSEVQQAYREYHAAVLRTLIV